MSRQKTSVAGRAVLKAVRHMVEDAGGRCWIEDAQGVGHQRLIVEINGTRRFSPIAGSPRDFDVALMKKRSEVRRIVEELQQTERA